MIAPDGETMVQLDETVPTSMDAESLGQWVGDELKSRGALELPTPSTI